LRIVLIVQNSQKSVQLLTQKGEGTDAGAGAGAGTVVKVVGDGSGAGAGTGAGTRAGAESGAGAGRIGQMTVWQVRLTACHTPDKEVQVNLSAMVQLPSGRQQARRGAQHLQPGTPPD